MTDITGVNQPPKRRVAQDVTDQELWAWLESRHKGLRADVLRFRGGGEYLYFPEHSEPAYARAERLDDGSGSLREAAERIGVSHDTIWRVRKAKAGCDPAA